MAFWIYVVNRLALETFHRLDLSAAVPEWESLSKPINKIEYGGLAVSRPKTHNVMKLNKFVCQGLNESTLYLFGGKGGGSGGYYHIQKYDTALDTWTTLSAHLDQSGLTEQHLGFLAVPVPKLNLVRLASRTKNHKAYLSLFRFGF